MSLQDCPKMTAKCPHRVADCSTSAGDDCHYVKSAVAASAFTRGMMAFLGRTSSPQLPRLQGPLESYSELDKLSAEVDRLAITLREQWDPR